MRYEYKTVWVSGADARDVHFAAAVESEINRRAAEGWEYVDSMNNGALYGAVFVFRRAK